MKATSARFAVGCGLPGSSFSGGTARLGSDLPLAGWVMLVSLTKQPGSSNMASPCICFFTPGSGLCRHVGKPSAVSFLNLVPIVKLNDHVSPPVASGFGMLQCGWCTREVEFLERFSDSMAFSYEVSMVVC